MNRREHHGIVIVAYTDEANLRALHQRSLAHRIGPLQAFREYLCTSFAPIGELL
jgi:phage tail sheath gpL-like